MVLSTYRPKCSLIIHSVTSMWLRDCANITCGGGSIFFHPMLWGGQIFFIQCHWGGQLFLGQSHRKIADPPTSNLWTVPKCTKCTYRTSLINHSVIRKFVIIPNLHFWPTRFIDEACKQPYNSTYVFNVANKTLVTITRERKPFKI